MGKLVPYTIKFNVSKTIYIDESKILEGIGKNLEEIDKDDNGFLLIDVAKAIVEFELYKKLEEKSDPGEVKFDINFDSGGRN